MSVSVEIQEKEPCRYCLELLSPKANLSVCHCRAPLCRSCLLGELRLTASRGDRSTHCTVCREDYEIEACGGSAQWEHLRAFTHFVAQTMLPKRVGAMVLLSKSTTSKLQQTKETRTSAEHSPVRIMLSPLSAQLSPTARVHADVAERRVDAWQRVVHSIAMFLFVIGIVGLASRLLSWTESRSLLTLGVDLLTIISGVWLDELFNAPAHSQHRRMFGRRMSLLALHMWRLSDVLSIARGGKDPSGAENDWWLVKLHQLFFGHSICLFLYFMYVFLDDMRTAWTRKKWRGEVTVNGKGPILLEGF
eukprot:876787_1